MSCSPGWMRHVRRWHYMNETGADSAHANMPRFV